MTDTQWEYRGADPGAGCHGVWQAQVGDVIGTIDYYPYDEIPYPYNWHVYDVRDPGNGAMGGSHTLEGAVGAGTRAMTRFATGPKT